METSNVIQFYSNVISKWDYQRFQTRWRDSGSSKIRRVFKNEKFFHLIGQERKFLKTSLSKNNYSRCRKESSTKCRNSSSWKTKLFTWSFERSSSHSRRWTGTYRTSSFIGFWTFILFQAGFHGPTGSARVSGQVREMVKRDEIVWFIRHSSKENQNKKTAEEDFRDSKISELISSVIQLRTLVQKHSGNFSHVFLCADRLSLILLFSFIIEILRWSHAKVQCTFTSCRN